jgi:hypothetical protein
MSAGLGVVSLLPAAPLRGLMPDGYFIAWYFRDREGYRLWLDMTELYHRAFPTRPRDQAQADLQPRSSAAPYIAYLHLLRYCAEFDAGNVVAAFVEIQAAWDGIQALDKYRPYQASIAFETAVFFTRFAKDDELAATAFGFGLAADPKSDGRRGAEAAKLFVQGCVEEAMRMLDEDCKTVSERKDTRGRLVTHVREWNDRILDAAIPVWSREEMAVEAERGEYPRVCLPIPPAE